MKLHTSLNETEVHAALTRAQLAGHVTPDVHFPVYAQERSQTHPYGYEIQLGTYNQHSLPDGTKDQYGKTMRVRRFKNSGGSGASNVYAATWHEWGWFMAEVFQADPNARWGGNPDKSRRPEYVYGYASLSDFNAKTGNQFTTTQER